jgi:hypothetical protein
MRNQTLRVITVLVGTVLSFTGAMQAQYVPHFVKVTVPFEFTVGNKLLPAGDYNLACTPNQIELRDAGGKVVASAIHHSVRTADTRIPPKLVFATEGGGHALRQIWPGSTNYGYELAPWSPTMVMAQHRSNPPAQPSGGGSK